jgi:hypothetical protein
MDAEGRGRPADVSAGLAEVLGRALTDDGFREALFADRRGAVADFALSPADEEALDSIPRTTLDEHAQRFAEGSASAMTISVVIKGTF